MKKAIYSFIYYHLLGWKTNVTVPNYDKCVICAAPHTTNMDLFIGKLFYGAIGRKTSFMMKKEWFFFPLGILFKAVGGIPVNRGRKSSLVEQMAELEGVSEQLKAENQMEWVGRMNNIRNRVMEIVNAELIYS